jgi:hypothetical protein
MRLLITAGTDAHARFAGANIETPPDRTSSDALPVASAAAQVMSTWRSIGSRTGRSRPPWH